MKKILLVLLMALPALSWGQLDGYITPGIAGHLKIPSLTTAQILAISMPKEGMQAYDKIEHCMKYYNGTLWTCMNSTSSAGSQMLGSNYMAWITGTASTDDVPVTVKSDLDGNILALVAEIPSSQIMLLKLKKFTSTGTLLWETNICNSYYLAHGFLKINSQNQAIIVANGYGYASTNASSSVNFKTVINDAGTVDSSVALGSSTVFGAILANKKDFGSDVDFDSDGNMIVVGNFAGTRVMGAVTLQTIFDVNSGNYKLEQFIAKINPSGTVLWAYQWDSNTANGYYSSLNNSVYDLEIDDNNDLFVSCNSNISSGTCNIKTGASTYPLAYTNRALMIKFSGSNGIPQWLYSRSGNDTNLGTGVNINNRTYIKFAPDGVYLVGKRMIGSPTLTNSYLFIDKINRANKGLIWSRELENTSQDATIPTDITLDNNGGIYLGAYFGSCIALNATTNVCSIATLNSSYTDRLIIKLNATNGTYTDHKLMGPTPYYDSTPVFVTVNRYGLFSVSSFTQSNVVFGSTTLSSSGSGDTVFMRCY